MSLPIVSQPTTKKQPYYVYLIQGETSKITKIGISDDPSKRLKQLQRYNTETLVLSATLQCEGKLAAREMEKNLHSLFAEFRVRGEWFKLTPQQILAKAAGIPRNEPESDSFMDWFRFNLPYICIMIVALLAFVVIMGGLIVSTFYPGTLSDPNVNQNLLCGFWVFYSSCVVVFLAIVWAVKHGR